MHKTSTKAHTPPVSEIMGRYGLQVVSYDSHDSHYKRGAAIRVRTPQHVLLLKPCAGDEHTLDAITGTMESLWNQGYRRMPQLVKTLHGRRFTVLGGNGYYVTRWIEGGMLGADPRALWRLGRALAELHGCPGALDGGPTAAAGLGVAKLNTIRHYDREFRAATVSALGRAGPDQGWLARHHQAIASLANEAWGRLERADLRAVLATEDASAPLVHGDVTRHNIITDAAGHVTLIDWDRVRRGSSWLEVVNALCNTTQFDPLLMSALLDGYAQVRPLALDERRLLSTLYHFPREIWYARQEDHGQVVWNSSLLRIFRNTWPERLRAVRWLDEWAEGR